MVNFRHDDIDLVGQLVNIQINEALPNSLRGELGTITLYSHNLNFSNLSPDRLLILCGELNKNLKQIEKALHIKVKQNGTEFSISGKKEDVNIGVNALFDLKEKLELNSTITPDIVHLSLHSAKFEETDQNESTSLFIKNSKSNCLC